MSIATNKGADQPEHRLFRFLIAGYLLMLKHAKTRMSMMQLVSVAEEAGLKFTW